jgi:exodeoxyribonuclease VII large subunit
LTQHRERLASLNARLRLLSPENVLARGYSLTLNRETGQIIRKAKSVKAGQALRTKFADGEVNSIVEGSSPAKQV